MALSIHRHFSPSELNQLESGLPRLTEWSDAMLVPFQARQLRHARILWINPRWFLERMLDVASDEVQKRISAWLLDEFAYVIPQPGDPEQAFTGVTRTLHADRYGSSTGRSAHGGSGRVATVGCYQVKGVGATPLVGVGGDAEHATGYCSVEEGIREAIYAEVACAEFPHGAVPIVAILDSGLTFDPRRGANMGANASAPIRRALVIRPAVLRIAHAERAPLFTRSLTGATNSQSDDARRTRDVIRRWSRQAQAPRGADIDVPALPELVSRIVRQVAFGQVHRLFSGGYFSANLSATGELLDFGGMRAVPNWVNARNLDAVVGFGDEMKIVHKLIESIAFYFNKYRPELASTPPSATALRAHAERAYAEAFTRECLRIWDLHQESDLALTQAVMRALRRYFTWQQKLKVNYKHGAVTRHGWLYESLRPGESSPGADSMEAQTLEAISAALEQALAHLSDRGPRSRHAWLSAARHLMPRDSLDREELQRALERRLAGDGQISSEREWIAQFVRSAVSRGRRHWPALPGSLAVQAHVAHEGSSALLCTELSTGAPVYWYEGIRTPGAFRLFDTCLTPEQASQIDAKSNRVHWTARVSVSARERAPFIQVPDLHVRYGEP